MPNQRIGIIGHFGGGKNFLDGQTVKTKILYEELVRLGYQNIVCVDTYYNRTNKVKLLWDSLLGIAKCKTIIILLSGNGMRIYFPLLYVVKKLSSKRVFHDVIGGNLAEYVKMNPKYKKYLNSFDGNWVEFERMRIELKKLGIRNCAVVPNFKRLKTKESRLKLSDTGKNSFCMFSRIMEEKGVTEAIETIANYNRDHGEKVCLEIWGPVDKNYRAKFKELLNKYKDCVSYKGTVNYDKSVETLTDHIALLFPTHWNGEGFPGTIVDAYAAAVPVIASDWNANSELIDNFVTGWVYPNQKVRNLNDSIEWAMEHKDDLIRMRSDCLENAKKYMPEANIPVIVQYIEGVH